jgi:hypothetical protein
VDSRVSTTIPVEIDVERLMVRYAYPVPGKETVIVTETFKTFLELVQSCPELMPHILADQLQRNMERRHKSLNSNGYQLPPAKMAEFQALGQNVPPNFPAFLNQILKETSAYLTSLESSVRDGKCVDEAADFSRWLQFSGILSMLEMFAESNPEFGRLRHRVMDLAFFCADYLGSGKVSKNYCQSDIDSINAKLDFLLSAFAKSASPAVQHTLDSCA